MDGVVRRLAVFRADASPAVGGGHVMRCLTLAHALKNTGWDCVFWTDAETFKTVPAPKESGYSAFLLSSLPVTEKEKADLLVVDHYGLGADFERSCRAWARCVLILDDLADREHDCDLLMDQTFGRAAVDYEPLVPSGCRVLAGPDYALLREEFSVLRPAALAQRATREGRIERVLVSFGTTDPVDATGLALEALQGIEGLDIDIVLGSAAPHLEKTVATVAAMPRVCLHVDTRQMPQLMARADLAIAAGGTTSWERCCLGLPTIMIGIANNQETITRNLCAAGAAIDGGRHGSAAAATLLDIILLLRGQPDQVMTMAERAASICDGTGAQRVMQEIGQCLN